MLVTEANRLCGVLLFEGISYIFTTELVSKFCSSPSADLSRAQQWYCGACQHFQCKAACGPPTLERLKTTEPLGNDRPNLVITAWAMNGHHMT
jgi:hypothetical protein